MSQDRLGELLEAHEHVSAARDKLNELSETRNQLLFDALADGVTIAEVSERLGLSRSMIHRITKRARESP